MLPRQQVGCGWARNWEGIQLGQLTPTDQRDIPYRMTSCSAVKAWGKDEERGAFVVMAFVFSSHCDEGLEAVMEMAKHPLLMGSSD